MNQSRHLLPGSQHRDIGDTTLPIPVLGRSLAAGTVLAGGSVHPILGSHQHSQGQCHCKKSSQRHCRGEKAVSGSRGGARSAVAAACSVRPRLAGWRHGQDEGAGRMEAQMEWRHMRAGVSCTCWSRARVVACEAAPGARDREQCGEHGRHSSSFGRMSSQPLPTSHPTAGTQEFWDADSSYFEQPLTQ